MVEDTWALWFSVQEIIFMWIQNEITSFLQWLKDFEYKKSHKPEEIQDYLPHNYI